jgi:hypothetical protein
MRRVVVTLVVHNGGQIDGRDQNGGCRRSELSVFTVTSDPFNPKIQPNPTCILPELVQLQVQSEPTRSNPKWFGSGNRFIVLFLADR